jgi:hypothetical protein
MDPRRSALDGNTGPAPRGGEAAQPPRLIRARAVWTRRTGVLLLSCAAALCVWIVPLSLLLPAHVDARHWPWAWVGLDTMEAVSLAATGILTLRRDPRVGAVAGAATALLLADAWFDITTAQMGSAVVLALILAGVAELPLATLCAWLAWKAPVRFATSSTAPASGHLRAVVRMRPSGAAVSAGVGRRRWRLPHTWTRAAGSRSPARSA